MKKNDYKEFALTRSLPKEWDACPLKFVISLRDGGSWGEESKNDGNDHICIRITDFDYANRTVKRNANLTIRNYSDEVYKRLKLQKGDIIIEKSGGGDKVPVGRTIVFNEGYDAVFVNFTERLRVRPEHNYEYINYCMMAFYGIGGSFNFFNQTTGLQNLSVGKYLSDIYIPLPPRQIQDKIVSKLNVICDKINDTISKHNHIIEMLEEYKTSITITATTKGIKNTEFKESGEGWLGNIPENWNVRRVWSMFKETNERGNASLPILTVSINDGISDKELSEDESVRVFVRSEDKTKYKRMKPGDIVYNMMRAWQGAFGTARVDGMVSPAYITARPIEKMDSRYFEYLMRSDNAAQEFEKYSRGIADFRLRLYWPEFKNIKLCVPPIDEQTEIADYLDDIYSKIEQAKSFHLDLISKLEEYRNSIIYSLVTGRISCEEVQNG